MRKSRRQMIGQLALSAGLVLAGTALIGAQPASAQDKITVGIIPITDCAPIFLGKQKGFFTKQNLDVNIESAQGGAELVNPVVSGQREFGFSNVSSLLIAQTRGLDLVAVSPGASSTGEQGRDFGAIVAPGDSPIKNAKDLEGKTVAVNNLKNIGDTSVNASVRAAEAIPRTSNMSSSLFQPSRRHWPTSGSTQPGSWSRSSPSPSQTAPRWLLGTSSTLRRI
jgi:NitT/TauT family transport system substrate-binding protein